MVNLAQLLKAVSEQMDGNALEVFVDGLIGQYVHISINEHDAKADVDGEVKTHNVWFAGKVAGYEKGVLYFDWFNQAFIEGEPQVHITLLMTDGTGWLLSTKALEIQEITEEEFNAMVASEIAKQAVAQETMNIPIEAPTAPKLSLITGGKTETEILLPGRDF